MKQGLDYQRDGLPRAGLSISHDAGGVGLTNGTSDGWEIAYSGSERTEFA